MAQTKVQGWARQLGLRPGEVTELLERLPFGDADSDTVSEPWEREDARSLLESYAARRRAVTRLVQRGRL